MNMFRNLLTVILMALGFGVWLSDPTTWKWADPAGPYVVEALQFLAATKPFSVIILLVLALALFITRKQY
jgi:hypothetical protein